LYIEQAKQSAIEQQNGGKYQQIGLFTSFRYDNVPIFLAA
jgi:hypothetical protein